MRVWVIRNHGREYRELTELADTLDVSIPHCRTPISANHSSCFGPQDGASNCAYAAEVVDHMLDLKEYKDEVDKDDNPKGAPLRRRVAAGAPLPT